MIRGRGQTAELRRLRPTSEWLTHAEVVGGLRALAPELLE
ncbi:hypothetical protein LMG3458_01957 [Achromobacter deleyi]|uniref:Uncharacterized protein n=1 Tax=Achromobacter deleyi TaxID=1353891 RepID=A0A6S6ZMC4_9BURK|nr:hypothetical protein LMG3458_01957 [Achromobacter deleyi]CAB3869710.1 hypothetical protein LMG3482_02717 [Achromobacter deleyi]CAB3878772.1 hypothetical protein LMG3481_03145 [Achromobacter deleyi]